MKKSYINFKKQKGFTAIELLFALGIIAIATVVIVRVMGSNSDKAKSQQMIQDVSALVDNIKGAYASSSAGYTGLDNTSVIAGKLYPSDLATSGTATIKSQFSGGDITIAVGSDVNTFTIEYTNVPTAVCTDAISKLAGDTFSEIDAGSGSKVYPSPTAGTPIDPTLISTGCGSSTAPNVTFTITN